MTREQIIEAWTRWTVARASWYQRHRPGGTGFGHLASERIERYELDRALTVHGHDPAPDASEPGPGGGDWMTRRLDPCGDAAVEAASEGSQGPERWAPGRECLLCMEHALTGTHAFSCALRFRTTDTDSSTKEPK
ncbi:hypothetical protein [Streptomyces halobius]|uniref:Uncharacterized protein n=1 Tax=Streptomyces halobius TaxID=2879846 RepID=A0ABY4M4M0_9ACTN|nr:hypothetical protein [Streptomyces halobius]UQA92670.1 hypothetical protein K9S39_13280 [Streptomyces halobius]